MKSKYKPSPELKIKEKKVLLPKKEFIGIIEISIKQAQSKFTKMGYPKPMR